MNLTPPHPIRSTMGVCLGLRGGLKSAVVVLSCRRDDQTRTLYVVREREWETLDVDAISEELRACRATYRTVRTVGYHGGRDDDEVFKTLTVRLGHHVEPAPGDPIAPTQLLIDDFRTGRLKARQDSLVVRDAQAALWRAGVPDQTGILAALRCAHWAAQSYRPKAPKKKLTDEDKLTARERDRRRRIERPF